MTNADTPTESSDLSTPLETPEPPPTETQMESVSALLRERFGLGR